ncbi:MoaD/ThiS family protein [Candidatus Micrarchaeota archaeon]|nr:MoaD/ThiS family protein [Candidatus Micrarchaeota archaeon]
MELVFDNKKKRMRFSGDVASLLKKLGVMREEVVVKVNGRLAPETRPLLASDRVEVIKVVFGG